MTIERTFGLGEVVYRTFDSPPCADCAHVLNVHRYVVVSDTKMAPDGCDGDGTKGCPCRKYRASENATGPPSREETWARYPNDAMSIRSARESPTTRCRQPLCGAPIWWGVTVANNRRCPFDIEPNGKRTGTSHWRTCKDRPPQPSRRKK